MPKPAKSRPRTAKPRASKSRPRVATSRPRTAKSRPRASKPPASVAARRAPARTGRATVERADVAIALLFAVPMIIIPGGLDRFVFGKLLIAAAGIAVAFLAPATGRLPRAVRRLLASAAALLALSAALSAAPAAAFAGRAERYEGVLVLAVYLLAGVCGARLLGPDRSPRSVRVAAGTMAVVALAVALLAVVESFGLRPLSTDLDRPGSLLGNASDEGAFAVLYAGPLLYDAIRRRSPLVVAGAGAAVLTVVLSASRGALLGLVGVFVVLALLLGRRSRRLVGATCLGAIAVVLAVPFVRDRVLGTSPLAGHTANGRTLLWRETLSLLTHHPVLGIGPSQFEAAIVREHDLTWQTRVGPANPPESPHDWILQTLDAGGVLLLVVVIWLVVLVVRAALRRARAQDHWAGAALAGLVGYGVALLFHLTAPATAIPAAVLAGSLLAVAPDAARDLARDAPLARARRWAAPAVTGVATLLALAFLLASISEIYLKGALRGAQHGDLAGADRDYRTASALRPWDVDLPAQAAHAFATLALAGDADAVPYGLRWERRRGVVSGDEQIVEDRAALLAVGGDLDGAAALLDRALHLDPDNPLLLLRRGVLYAQADDGDSAERAFLRAVDISPRSPEPWRDLATLYSGEGKTAQAQQADAKAARLQAAH